MVVISPSTSSVPEPVDGRRGAAAASLVGAVADGASLGVSELRAASRSDLDALRWTDHRHQSHETTGAARGVRGDGCDRCVDVESVVVGSRARREVVRLRVAVTG